MNSTTTKATNRHSFEWSSEHLIKRDGCPLCGIRTPAGIIKRKDNLTLIRCSQCPLAYVDPIPDPATISAYYDKDYFLGKKSFFAGVNYCDTRHQDVLSGIPVTGYREIIKEFNPIGKDILEIGCSSGTLLYQLKTHNPRSLIGLDCAPFPVTYGKKTYELNLRCADLQDEKFCGESFDLVIMVDVLEHIRNPLSLVKEINRILRPAGTLFLITPNFDAFQIAKSDWLQLSSNYEHLQYFSRSSLTFLANQSSFHLKHAYTRGLPISLSQYPESHPFPGKYFLYPHIAAINFYRKFRYGKAATRGWGNDLVAFLEKKRSS